MAVRLALIRTEPQIQRAVPSLSIVLVLGEVVCRTAHPIARMIRIGRLLAIKHIQSQLRLQVEELRARLPMVRLSRVRHINGIQLRQVQAKDVPGDGVVQLHLVAEAAVETLQLVVLRLELRAQPQEL